MNIRILDTWLREFIKTKASAKQIAEALSLTSVSVERLEKRGLDFVYDIEVTTNRPDLMSVVGIAREAAAVLPQFGIIAMLSPLKYTISQKKLSNKYTIDIQNNPRLVNRICAAILEVRLDESPQYIKERLEASGIRSLNNLIDVTNYVMRETGHPTHVFDYDRLTTKKLVIREAKKGEQLTTLDGKEYRLPGGDIVADNGNGKIVDLLGVMGTANSVATDQTKRILYFIDNNEPTHIRKTSMSLGVRTEAAILNEKGVDPELAHPALFRGIELFQQVANAKLLSDIIDIYPNKPKKRKVVVSEEKIHNVIGIDIPTKKIIEILSKLGFESKIQDKPFSTPSRWPNGLLEGGPWIEVNVPSWRVSDIQIEEDVIEEVARIYGYHKLPSKLPPIEGVERAQFEDRFYWEKRAKDTLKYWGFTEVYTYSMVSGDLYEGPLHEAVTIQNPLNEDMVYMRKTLIPSLLQVVRENKNREELRIFEIANIYIKKTKSLPHEILTLAAVVKKLQLSFYEVKGIVEQLLYDLGIKNIEFKKRKAGGLGAEVYIEKDHIGNIEVLEEDLINFEFNFEGIIKHATLKKIYKPVSKFPPLIEDVSVIIDPKITYRQIVELIKKQSTLIIEVSLLDMYENKKTFRIKYQDPEKNLTNEEVIPIREKIYKVLEKDFGAKIT